MVEKMPVLKKTLAIRFHGIAWVLCPGFPIKTLFYGIWKGRSDCGAQSKGFFNFFDNFKGKTPSFALNLTHNFLV